MRRVCLAAPVLLLLSAMPAAAQVTGFLGLPGFGACQPPQDGDPGFGVEPVPRRRVHRAWLIREAEERAPWERRLARRLRRQDRWAALHRHPSVAGARDAGAPARSRAPSVTAARAQAAPVGTPPAKTEATVSPAAAPRPGRDVPVAPLE